VLALRIFGILSFPYGYPVAAYAFFLVFLSLLTVLPFSFNNVFQKAVPTQNVTNPINLPSFYCTLNISPLLLDFMQHKTAVCSEIHTKHTNVLCKNKVEFLNFNTGGKEINR
jgi:hypothetical protein